MFPCSSSPLQEMQGTSPGILGCGFSCWVPKTKVQRVVGKEGQYWVSVPSPLPHPTPVNTNPGSESLISLVEKVPHVPSPCLYSAGRRCTRGNKDLLWGHTELVLCGKRKQAPGGDWILRLSYPWVSSFLVAPTFHIPADDRVSIVLKSVSESGILPRPIRSLPQAGKTTFSIPDPNPTSFRPATLVIFTE